jgi:DNA-binding transcriptional LysR family regulator
VIRIMPLSDSRLAAKQIGLQHLAACASPDYLSRHGTPVHPLRLEEQTFVVFRNPTSGRERPAQFAVNGQVLDIRPPYRILMDDSEGMVEAAKLGVGLTQVPAYMAADELARGTLAEMLAAFKPAVADQRDMARQPADASEGQGIHQCRCLGSDRQMTICPRTNPQIYAPQIPDLPPYTRC